MNTEREIEQIKRRLALLEGTTMFSNGYLFNPVDFHICDWEYFYGYRKCRYCGKIELIYNYPTKIYPAYTYPVVYPICNPPIVWCCGDVAYQSY